MRFSLSKMAAFLCACALMAGLAGCGDGAAPAAASTTTSASTTASASTTTTAKPSASAPDSTKPTVAASASATAESPVDKRNESDDNGGFAFTDLNGWDFWFGSGAGGWRTELQISSDGTFNGIFTDSEMGTTGEDNPNGTVYVCDFTGKFTSPIKIGDFEYLMNCESLTQQGAEGEEEIIDGVKYITSTPYGFDNAGEFRLYLPGKKLSELPAEYQDWIRSAITDGDEIDFYGLYNIGGEQGFSSASSEPVLDDGSTENDIASYSESQLTFDSGGFERISHNKYTLDGLFFVTLEAAPNEGIVYGEESVSKRVKELEGLDSRELQVSLSDEISNRLTFPAWLVYYDKGENEDTNYCVDLYFQSDTTEYRVHTEVDADAAAEYADAYNLVLDSVKVRYVLTEEDAMQIVSEKLAAQLSEGFSILSSGEGTVNGQRAFLFETGKNESDRFTAEEHYAVTDDGDVWILDITTNEWNEASAG